MPTTIELHTGETVVRKPATSRIAESFGNHRTLCVGILYATTIIAVLALVAKL